MNLRLDGKAVAVTGGSRGIGNAIARRVAEEGADVSICARSGDPLRAAADRIADDYGVDALPVPADLTDPAAAARFVDETVDRFDGLDVLVNNAGDAPPGLLADLDEADWNAAVDLKLMGLVRCATAAMPSLVAASGAMVNVVGNAGVEPLPGSLTTGAVNAAAENLTRSLAKHYGPKGVRVNAVNPGPVDTERWAAVVDRIAEERGLTADAANELAAGSIALGRVCEPREVANVVAFLASSQASFVNGAALRVDGGQSVDLLAFDRIEGLCEAFG